MSLFNQSIIVFFLVFAYLLDMAGNTTSPEEKNIKIISFLRFCVQMILFTLGGAVIPTQG